MFDVELYNSARQFLKKSDQNVSGRITEKIEKLRQDPFPSDTKRVVNTPEKLFRIRVGDYRILYEVDYKTKKVIIVYIEQRSQAYKK